MQQQNTPAGTSKTTHIAIPENKPKKKSKLKRLGHYCYNKEKRTCMNRGCNHWSMLLLYYLLFHLMAVLLFIIMYYMISNQLLDMENSPVAYVKQSASPCPTFVPTVESSGKEVAVWYVFSGKDKDTNQHATRYVKAITQFIKDQRGKCDDCPFDMSKFGPCGSEDYGYSKKTPCIYLKLNNMVDFSPKPFEHMENVPSDVPNEIKTGIDVQRKTAWVYCKGETKYDEDLLGPVQYYPENAFNDKFFPIKNKGPSPFVAIQLTNVQVGYVLSLKCFVTGANIDNAVNSVQMYFYIGLD